MKTKTTMLGALVIMLTLLMNPIFSSATITNGGFESSGTWTYNGTCSRQGGWYAHAGSYGGGCRDDDTITQDFANEPSNDVVYLRMYVKSDATTGTFKAKIYFTSGDQTFSHTFSAANTWEYFYIDGSSFTASKTIDSIALWLNGGGSTQDTSVDDVVLLIDGGGPG